MLIEASPYGQMAEKQAEHERMVTDVEAIKMSATYLPSGSSCQRRRASRSAKWSIEATR